MPQTSSISWSLVKAIPGLERKSLRSSNSLYVSKTGSPFEHALYYFKTGNYNNGEKGYNATVKQLGKTIFNTPIIQQWWKDSEYNPRNTGKAIKHSNGGYLFSGKENTVPENNWNTGYLYNGPTS